MLGQLTQDSGLHDKSGQAGKRWLYHVQFLIPQTFPVTWRGAASLIHRKRKLDPSRDVGRGFDYLLSLGDQMLVPKLRLIIQLRLVSTPYHLAV